MTIFGRIFGDHHMTLGQAAYNRAMKVTDDFISQIRQASHSPVRSVVSDVISHGDNMPFMTTVYEAVEEMKVLPKDFGAKRAGKR
jgi:hypothetical protein